MFRFGCDVTVTEAPQAHSNSPPGTGPINGHVWEEETVRMLSHRSKRPFGTAKQSLAQAGYELQWACLFLSEPHQQDCQCDNSTAHRKIQCQYCEAFITKTAPVFLSANRFTALSAALFTRILRQTSSLCMFWQGCAFIKENLQTAK
jgi:hypothetical protein